MRTPIFSAFLILLITLLVNPAVADNVSFDNQIKDNNNVGISSWNKFGDVITLSGNGREITEFTFHYYQGGALVNPTGRVIFYSLDSLTGFPGDVIWDSGLFEMDKYNDAGYFQYTAAPMSTKVPKTFIWTIELAEEYTPCEYWCNGTATFFSPLVVGEPSVGSSENYIFEYNVLTSSWEKSYGNDLIYKSLAATIKTKNKAPLESIMKLLLMDDD